MADTKIFSTQHSNIPASIGRSLGQGVSSGLEDLLARKMQQKSDSIKASHLRTLMPGASQEEINALAHFGSSIYEPALRGGFGAIQKAGQLGSQPQSIETQPQQNMNQQIQPIDYIRALGAIGLKMTPDQEKQIQALSPEQQEKVAETIFNKLPPKAQQRMEDLITKAQLPEQNQSNISQQVPQQVIGSQQPGVAPQQQPVSLSQALQGGNKGNERLQFDKEKERAIQDRYAHKANTKLVHDILGLEKAKHEEDNILKRIIKVSEKEGSNVRNPVLTGIMKDIGIDYQGLKNGDTLEVEKLSNWFLRGGVKMFGGRVSNAEMFALLSQVPNALQTKEGRIRLAKQMLLANQDYHDEAKTMKQIIKENKGKYPLDLELQIDDRMASIREKNADKFINGIYNETKGNDFKAGQKISASQVSSLPEGTIYKKGGKRFEIKDGKEVEL